MRLVQRDPNTAYVSNWLWVPKVFTNVESVRNALSFEFPDNYNEKKTRLVYLWKETDHHILVPRHFWRTTDIPYRVVDLRPQQYEKTGITSSIKLDHRMRNGVLTPDGNDVQQRSLQALLSEPGGTLQLACGLGKTVVALELVTRLQVPTLIALPDTSLLEQWSVDIDTLLDVPGGVGLIQGAKNDWQKSVVLTTYHTIGARAQDLPEAVRRWFGLIIWDEGHHVPAPTFAASAEAFYGKRVSLTATPERDDGHHIINQYHIGPVVYKDLTPVQKPRIFFKWTGLEIDESRPDADVRDKNGEIHGSKVSSYNARWAERRADILNDAAYAVQCGRKVLVLSSSEAEIANMAAMWSSGDIGLQPKVPLYTDIPQPAPMDVGETLLPADITVSELRVHIRQSIALRKKVRELASCSTGYATAYDALAVATRKLNMNTDTRPTAVRKLTKDVELRSEKLHQFVLSTLVQELHYMPDDDAGTASALCGTEQTLGQYAVHKKLVAELDKRQKAYVKKLYQSLTNCGMMVFKVPAKERKRLFDTTPITFAITKYGKEGLNSEALDTILVSSVFSSRNGLQQLNGRNTRDFVGKKSPVTVFYEDNIGHVIGMCRKLKKHLREWDHSEGGPYDFEQIGHPNTLHRSGTWQSNLQRIFGQ
jgi:superfamily II DNA or RNA helicase